MTDTTKRYRLLKDLPDSKVGDIYIWNDGMVDVNAYYKNGDTDSSYWCKENVENNPEWFEEVLPVSEPVKEMVGVTVTEMNTYNSRVHYGYSFNVHSVDIDCGKIKQAIESALNDTVVEDRFDGKRVSFYAMDEVGQWAAADKELTKEKIDELMKEFHNQPLQFYSPPKRYSQSEVDAIRADTWYAARKITDKVVGEIDFKDGDRCPFYEKYFNSINDYLSSLNLNSNDTGKELFTTLDGVKIFRGDTYFPVDDNFNILFTTNAQQEYKDAGWLRAFSTYDAAQYWVSENKPKPEQPTNDNAFVWTDALVLLLCDFCHHNGYHKFDKRVVDEFDEFKEIPCHKRMIPDWIKKHIATKQSAPEPSAPVSYTHLTLPTSDLV